ncbi:MAG: glycosyltransferase, partial [Gammaproteobacteria bacterium]|nr:glycosyltransferase [Gammaproteobacteria bacterium]NIO63529.1 glycosyltransferase [Gammaproteobacteria bacterium]NIT14562.1 glycosyltransferase [Candidatus Dadabacteria bacterium]NIT41048.1 glycosyltransferase [Gammaproteobacteria bacterium]
HPGCKDAIIPDVTGLLIPPRNASALADAIKKLMNNDILRKSMGIEGRKLAERKFSIDKIIDAHLQIYNEILEGAK